MEIISNIALISINETLIVQLVSFLIFLFIINRVMFRPLQSVMGERDQYIESVRLGIGDAQRKLDELTGQLSERENTVRTEANQLRAELEESGNRRAAELMAAVSSEVAAMRDEAQRAVAADIEAARQEISRESEALAISIMEKVLERRLVS